MPTSSQKKCPRWQTNIADGAVGGPKSASGLGVRERISSDGSSSPTAGPMIQGQGLGRCTPMLGSEQKTPTIVVANRKSGLIMPTNTNLTRTRSLRLPSNPSNNRDYTLPSQTLQGQWSSCNITPSPLTRHGSLRLSDGRSHALGDQSVIHCQRLELDRMTSKIFQLDVRVKELEDDYEEAKGNVDFLTMERKVLMESLKEAEDLLAREKERTKSLEGSLAEKDEMLQQLASKYVRHREIWQKNDNQLVQEIKKLDDIIDKVVSTLKCEPNTVDSCQPLKDLLDVLVENTGDSERL